MEQTKLFQGGMVAAKSFTVLVLVGIIEVFVGFSSGSIALVTDGIYSFGDATVSLVIWLGLRLSRKAPDGKFHFGYYRVETFSSIVASLFMIFLGSIITYESYQSLFYVKHIVNAEVALATALVAIAIALVMSFYKTRAAKRLGSLALKADAFNSIRDALTSITAFLGVSLSHYFGLVQTDSMAGIVIALFIFTVAYSIIKEASLVLMDACSCPEIVAEIEGIAKGMAHVKGVHDIRLRKLGPYVVGDMHIDVDGTMTVKEADEIRTQIEEKIKEEFDEITEFKIRIEPHEPET